MKTTLASHRRALLLAAGIAAGAGIITAGAHRTCAAETGSDKPGFMEQVERWQDKMSETFRDTWKNLRGNSATPSVSTASVDLREQDNSYTVRLNLPDRRLDQVAITLDGELLHIVAPAEGGSGRYEQTMTLPGVASGAKLKIDRKADDKMIVVTVPKTDGLSKIVPPSDPSLAPLSDWDRDILGRMEMMNREMDRIFDNAFRDFRTTPEHRSYFDLPSFGSSVDLKEEGPNYVASVFLPERDMNNVNVTVEDRTLKIEAKAETTTAEHAKASSTTRKTLYSQMLTLPGPVQVEKMKVERKEGVLTVTLPKA